MIRKFELYNRILEEPAHPLAESLERDGHAFRAGALSTGTVTALRDEVADVFDRYPADRRKNCLDAERGAMFRYEMFNRSPRCQEVLARRELLEVVEPVLGDDCHVVACTAWRNPPGRAHAPYGQEWHVDGGPHVVRPAGVPWPDAIPYPIFVVTAHVYLEPVALEDGPTAVLPGSHRSGGLPPHERRLDLDLTYEGREGLAHVAEPGDVGFFVFGLVAPSPAAAGDQHRPLLPAGHLRAPRDRAARPAARGPEPRQRRGAHPRHDVPRTRTARHPRAGLLRRLKEAHHEPRLGPDPRHRRLRRRRRAGSRLVRPLATQATRVGGGLDRLHRLPASRRP